MQSKLAKKCRSKVLRQGLSVVEFVGCLVALCGGVAMGLMYLGIDLQGLATDGLHYSETVAHEELNLSDDSEELGTLASDTSKGQPLADGEETLASEKINQDTGSSSASPEEKTEVAAESATQPESESKPSQEFTESQREKVTQYYWKVLTACVRQEALGRQSGVKSIENWQLLDHLTHRLDGHQAVVDTIEQLDDHGVDQKVTFHANQVVAWHLSGAKLYQRALDLITDGPKANLLGPVAQSWQSAATQHRMEEKLVQEKHLGVANYLAYTYDSLGPSKPVALP